MTTPNHTKMPTPLPMEADDLRHWLVFKALECRGRHWGDASPSQARSIAMRLDVVFKGSETQRRDRLDMLEYVFGRNIVSSKSLTRSEASAIIDWISRTPPDVLAQECQRCLVAYRVERGQRTLEL